MLDALWKSQTSYDEGTVGGGVITCLAAALRPHREEGG